MNLTMSREEEKALLLLMGVTVAFDEQSLKKAYRRKVMVSHPDRAHTLGKDPAKMQVQFQEINDAFQLLLDKIRKDNSLITRSSYRKNRAGAYKHPSGTGRKQQSRRGTSSAGSYKARQGKSARPEGSTKKYHRRNAAPGQFYKGILPPKILRFAEYLYYTGEISWEELIHAIVWQYRNRPKLGELAESMGFLDNRQVLQIIKKRKLTETFGHAAVRLGMVERKTLDQLVRAQRMIGLPIGKYFTDRDIFSEEQLQQKLMSFRRHNYLHQPS